MRHWEVGEGWWEKRDKPDVLLTHLSKGTQAGLLAPGHSWWAPCGKAGRSQEGWAQRAPHLGFQEEEPHPSLCHIFHLVDI